MAKKANSLKENKNKRKTHSNTKKKRTNGNFFRKVKAILINEKFHKITGLFFILFSFILLISFTSYFFTWRADDFIHPGDKADNWIGNAGRAISKLFIERWFGIAFVCFCFVVFHIWSSIDYLKSVLLPLGKQHVLSFLP